MMFKMQMKRKLLNAALLLFLGVFWLHKCNIRSFEWDYIAFCFAAYLCLSLIPQRIVSFVTATVITLGAGLFFREYFICFAPAVFACSAVFAAVSGNAAQPVRKDVVLLSALGAAAVCTGISLYDSLVYQKDSPFMHPAFQRYHLYLIHYAA